MTTQEKMRKKARNIWELSQPGRFTDVLREIDLIEQALLEAREEGRAEGIREAAHVCDFYLGARAVRMKEDILSLLEKK